MPTDDQRLQIVLTTAGSDEQAEMLARALIDRRLAACVNIVGQVCSVYRWKGETTREAEKLLVIKTAARLMPQVRETIEELHTYELPELIALPIEDGSPAYLKWLADEVSEAAS